MNEPDASLAAISVLRPHLPLEGVRVLAVEQYGAGPFGSMLLADLGADVIKIENPADGGDVSRSVGPHFFGPGDSHFYQTFNRNKRSITLDIKRDAGRRILHDLARRADAIMSNLRGDLPEKLGLTYAALAEFNPAIVCAHLSAYGREGSRRSWPGYDYLMQAEAGYLALTGEPDGPPARMGLSIVDYMSGLMCAFGLLAGVLAARASGRGTDVDVSLFDTALHNLAYLGTWFLNAGHVQHREPRSAHPSLVPSQLFPTLDGWIFIMCNKEKFWPLLAARLDRPEWVSDPRFATFAARLANRAMLVGELEAIFLKRATLEWLGLLSGAVPVAPVYDLAQALENPFAHERGGIEDFVRPDGGAPVRMLSSPLRIAGLRTRAHAAPAMGADTESVLGELGRTSGEIEALRRQGII